MHTYIHTYTHTCIHAYMHPHTHIHAYMIGGRGACPIPRPHHIWYGSPSVPGACPPLPQTLLTHKWAGLPAGTRIFANNIGLKKYKANS